MDNIGFGQKLKSFKIRLVQTDSASVESTVPWHSI